MTGIPDFDFFYTGCLQIERGRERERERGRSRGGVGGKRENASAFLALNRIGIESYTGFITEATFTSVRTFSALG